MKKSLVSKYRTQLMGVAILLIIFCHNSIVLGRRWEIAMNIAQCGVDIFLFLSGYGLFYSYQRNREGFIRRRLTRTLPTYICITVPFVIILAACSSLTFFEPLWEYSLISFFISGELSAWFVAAIILLYFLFPLFFSMADSSTFACLFALGMWSASVVISMMDISHSINTVFETFIVRIPIFVFGCYFARNEAEIHKKVDKKIYFMVLLASLLSIVIWMYMIKDNFWTVTRMLFFPLSVSSVMIISDLLDRTTFLIQHLNRILSFLGLITLELYLTHEKLLFLVTKFIEKLDVSLLSEGSIVVKVVTNFIAVFAAILISWLYKSVEKKVSAKSSVDMS